MSSARDHEIRVLLVEDDPDDHEHALEIFAEIQENGSRYELDWVTRFDDAIEALRREVHDVCLLDHHLGARDGIDVLVEAAQAGARVPIIVLTGKGNREIEKRLLAAGALDYLIKSEISADVLERSIRHSIERGRSVSTVRERERELRALFDASMDAMLIADDEGRCIDANPAALSLVGVSREQLLAMNVLEMSRADTREQWVRTWKAFLESGDSSGELELRRPDGGVRHVEFRAKAHFRPARHLLVVRDITARRVAEHQQRRLAAIVESAADAISEVTLDGNVGYWSPSAERMYQFSAEEIVGRSKRIVYPADRAGEFDDLLAHIRRGDNVWHEQTTRRRKDGTTFDASVTGSPVRENGVLVAASVITRDISDRKKLEARLAVSDRMASIGMLAAGLAHEVNNPLTAVIACLDFVAQEVARRTSDHVPPALRGAAPISTTPPAARAEQALVEAIREPLTDARAAANRIRDVVRDMKVFTRPEADRPGPVDLRQVIDTSVRLAWNEIRHRARLVTDYGELPLVSGNEARLGQVFLNLLINAAQAIRDGDVTANEIRIVTRTNERGCAVVEVNDTGVGISPDDADRIFEPFFTTKPVGIGTGLGLSICRRIVEECRGTIEAESLGTGRGSRFTLTLPAAAVAEAARVAARPVEAATGRGRVLVVDDEPLVSKVVERVLRTEHDVVCVRSGAEALDVLARGASYDVILCDMMMPQMTGMEVYDHLDATAPAMASRMVFLTGGAFTPAAREFLDRVPNQRIEKPFDAIHLRGVVRDRVGLERVEANDRQSVAAARSPVAPARRTGCPSGSDIDPRFEQLMLGIDLEALATSHEPTCGVFAADATIGYVNAAWMEFGLANGAGRVWRTSDYLLNAISEPLRTYYALHLAHVAATGEPWEHDYELSSATLRRDARLRVTALAGGLGLLMTHSIRVERPHEVTSSPLPLELHVRDDGFVTLCAHCRRAMRARSPFTWDWAPELIARSQVHVSHGLCEDCSARYFGGTTPPPTGRPG